MAIARLGYQPLLPFLRPYRFLIFRAFLCTLGFIGTMPLLAHILGLVAESVATGNVPAILQLAGGTMGMFVVRGLCQYGQDALMAQAALRSAKDIRVRVYQHLHELDLDYFAESRTGDLAYRLTEDVDRIGEVIGKFFHQFVPSVLQLILVVGYMVYLNWVLTATTLVVAPLVAVLIGWFGNEMLRRSRQSQDQISSLASLLAEVFSGIRSVRAFGTESYELQRFAVESEQSCRRKYATDRIRAIQYPVIGFLEAAGICLLFVIGSWLISQEQLTGSQFVAFCAGVLLLIDPIVNTTNSYNEIKQTEASVERILEILRERPSVVDHPDAQPLVVTAGEVTYDRVCFAYRPEQSVLRDISFKIFPGEVVALVGSSGAGKSTLINLLLRFYEPTGGRVCIDGTDIRMATLQSLRQQIAIVPQETVLFSGAIAANIAFGQITWDAAAVEAAAKIANAHDFIMDLPQGYDTWVGERGVTLSGGQRQRIAIARAVLHNPKILVLDEATSALDAESEHLVQEALQRLMAGRTVLVIAHRLATVRQCDRIFVVEKGQIVESGNHSELLSQGGRYAQFHDRQFS
jgi:ATP-binding cassette subfamily B protein